MPATGLRSLPVGFGGNASDLFTTPWPHTLGDKARDKFGNEYLFVDFATTGTSIGSVVSIDILHRATPLSSASNAGRVGVVVSAAPTTLQAGWVQVYGFAAQVQCDIGAAAGAASASDVSDTSTARIIVPTTIVTSPAGSISLLNLVAGTSLEATSIEINEIQGMWLAYGDAVTDFEGFGVGTSGNFDNLGLIGGAGSPALTSGYVSVASDVSGGVSGYTTGPIIGAGSLVACFLNYPYHLNSSREVHSVTS